MPQVLVVDVDITVRTAVVHQLDRLGVKADSAANGYEAMKRIRAWHYELILMDLQMPDMDGFETIAAIRAHERVQGAKPVPIIALSASGEKERTLAVGFDEYYEKPASTEDLQRLLDRWLPIEKRHHYESQ